VVIVVFRAALLEIRNRVQAKRLAQETQSSELTAEPAASDAAAAAAADDDDDDDGDGKEAWFSDGVAVCSDMPNAVDAETDSAVEADEVSVKSREHGLELTGLSHATDASVSGQLSAQAEQQWEHASAETCDSTGPVAGHEDEVPVKSREHGLEVTATAHATATAAVDGKEWSIDRTVCRDERNAADANADRPGPCRQDAAVKSREPGLELPALSLATDASVSGQLSVQAQEQWVPATTETDRKLFDEWKQADTISTSSTAAGVCPPTVASTAAVLQASSVATIEIFKICGCGN